MQHKERPPVYYAEYLQLDKILNAQEPESTKDGQTADDEMLFIIIHQAYELWFKQILFELDVIRKVFRKPEIANSSPDIHNCVHRLKRICRILEITVSQMTVMETMTPLDFLDFRDLLRPASGFQSVQFKMIEAALGLHYNARYGQGYYLSQLSEADIARVKKAEQEQSLFVLVNNWLERMPFINLKSNHWSDGSDFYSLYRNAYQESLLPGEEANLQQFDRLFNDAASYPEGRNLSFTATQNALFILLYRDYPLMQLPYELLSTLLEVDELLSMWRHRHIHMVQRTIGKRTGTGGSTGADYLQKAADSHTIFKELAELTSYLLPRTMLPKLPQSLVKELSYD
ncbi:MAG: tryptophan 2,3-dioxygenase [Bacteroidetes bacterium]|nr:tryptophan 2,3-dioxygenase [Bacteroidota bacterium]